MITVPQEWQLPQINQCCPGIGPLGEGVQKVVKGMEVVHMYEGWEKGRMMSLSALAGRELR